MESIAGNKPIPNLPKAGIVAAIIVAFAFPLAMILLLKHSPLSFWNKFYCSRLIFWVEVGLLWLYALKVERQGLLIWPVKRQGIEFLVSAVIILYLLSIAAQFIAAIPAVLGYHEDNRFVKMIAALIKGRPVLVVFISITAGFCEEVIFRGFILTRLSLLFKNSYLPVILSSVLFAAMHYGYNSLREYIFSFLIGIMMSVHYQRFGDIRPLIIVHFLIDLIALMLVAHYIK